MSTPLHPLRFTGIILVYLVAVWAQSENATWVFFKNKGPLDAVAWQTASGRLSAKAKLRRHGILDSTDLPVYAPYLDSLRSLGIQIRNISRWMNAATAIAPDSLIAELRKRSYVTGIRPVGRYIGRRQPGAAKLAKARADNTFWGDLYPALDMIQVPFLQDYVKAQTNKRPGEGVTIAMLDAGFDVNHPALRHLVDSAMILADSDFVAHDANVGSEPGDDPADAHHGTGTLSLIAGYDPHVLVGAAYSARFILARTENGLTETHTEEDNWIAALEWVEALGADIINSSLGYRYDFDDGSDFPDSLMDGNSVLVSRAAALAAARGLIICNSAGNDAAMGDSLTLNAPADAEDVITVGAVYYDGSLAGFSSIGPSYDGRIKPDVVAPGVNIPYANNVGGGYRLASGTSFSSPLTAGCIALIKQLHPDWTPSRVISVLHNTSSRHGNPNNRYGYGIVRAMACVLDSSSVFGGVFDSTTRLPLENATVRLRLGGDTIRTAASGLYWFNGIGAGRDTIAAFKPGWKAQSGEYPFPAAPPVRTDFLLRQSLDTNTIWARVETPSGDPVSGAGVLFDGPTSGTTGTDADGLFVIGRVLAGEYQFIIGGTGFQTLTVTVNAPVDSLLVLRLIPVEVNKILVYPIPCRGRLTFEFKADSAKLAETRYFTAELYSLDGTKVRSMRLAVTDGRNVREEMDLRGLRRGLYYCRTVFNQDTRLLKIPVIP